MDLAAQPLDGLAKCWDTDVPFPNQAPMPQ